MSYALTVISENSKTNIEIAEGQSLYEILAACPDIEIEAPCGGKGRCGKCKLTVVDGRVSALSELEKELLSEADINGGVRLACRTYPEGDVTVQLRETTEAHIAVSGIEYSAEVFPNVRKSAVKLTKPVLEDQRDDLSRLSDALGGAFTIQLDALRKLPGILRESDYAVTVAYDKDCIVAVEAGDTKDSNFGIAVDIGTTTVVAYLVNLQTGKIEATASGLNAQKPHGQDVISRISYTIDNPTGTSQLQHRIIHQINGMIEKLAGENGISIDQIYSITLAGNTTMMHFAAGLPTKHIAAAPFIPAAKRCMKYSAGELDLSIQSGGQVYLLPGVSAYIGADIVADLLSSGLADAPGLSLLIDVGTNGEIALGSRDGLYCCSTAAGPAFEGATIRHGMGGITGAINTVRVTNGRIAYTTIGDAPPAGVCGSGIVDAMAMLLDSGLVDESGRMLAPAGEPGQEPPQIAQKISSIDGEPAIVLADSGEAAGGEQITLTQKDVREIQLAKAAIAAGVMTLLIKAGKSVEDIDTVYLAGGFGSYIDKTSATRIGLIPQQLLEKIQVIGNGAGIGAVLSLISSERLAECERIASKAEYIELSGSPEFQDAYFECMMFPPA